MRTLGAMAQMDDGGSFSCKMLELQLSKQPVELRLACLDDHSADSNTSEPSYVVDGTKRHCSEHW